MRHNSSLFSLLSVAHPPPSPRAVIVSAPIILGVFGRPVLRTRPNKNNTELLLGWRRGGLMTAKVSEQEHTQTQHREEDSD